MIRSIRARRIRAAARIAGTSGGTAATRGRTDGARRPRGAENPRVRIHTGVHTPSTGRARATGAANLNPGALMQRPRTLSMWMIRNRPGQPPQKCSAHSDPHAHRWGPEWPLSR
jgi:hypothetical protein